MHSRISIVTPWRDHAELIPDYEHCVMGADVVIIDNGSQPGNAAEICAMTDRLGGTYIRNDSNRWFSFASNQGLEAARGQIVVCLNNDVRKSGPWLEEVRRDVPPGKLVGPSTRTVMVADQEVLYLEGWCVAACRETWDALGGWDAYRYPLPYWEDVDLAWRARRMACAVMPADWPLQHIGAFSSRGIGGAYDGWEDNYRALQARIHLDLSGWAPSPEDLYRRACADPSDINPVLPLLRGLAAGCDHITEFGTGWGGSASAFLHARPRTLIGYDLQYWPQLELLRAAADRSGIRFIFHRKDVLKASIDPTDLLFIDTSHSYHQLKRELELHSINARKLIVLHGTERFGGMGEDQSPGLDLALEEFLEEGSFFVREGFHQGQGLTVLERTPQ